MAGFPLMAAGLSAPLTDTDSIEIVSDSHVANGWHQAKRLSYDDSYVPHWPRQADVIHQSPPSSSTNDDDHNEQLSSDQLFHDVGLGLEDLLNAQPMAFCLDRTY